MSVALVIPIPSQPRPEPPAEDASPEEAKGIARVAEVMLAQGITPSRLARCPSLAKYIPPLEALIAERAADLARTLRDARIGITPEVLRLNAAAQPDLADLYTGTAEAMELLEGTP